MPHISGVLRVTELKLLRALPTLLTTWFPQSPAASVPPGFLSLPGPSWWLFLPHAIPSCQACGTLSFS